jgi:hypothetical protein
MREEVYDARDPTVYVGTRLGRIRDNPDDDENYYNPGYDLRYQSSYLLCLAKYLFLRCPPLPKMTGMASPGGSPWGSGASMSGWQIP